MKYLILLLLIVGCGTRKTEIEKESFFEVNNTYSQGSKIVLGTNLTFMPFDNSKPFKVDGKQYDNVVVSNSTSKTVQRWKIKTIYRTRIIYRTKIIEKTDHTILYASMFFIACLFIFLWFYLKKYSLAR